MQVKNKIIFFDVDGTLVANANVVPDSAIQAIKQARENGYLCYVCTGRNSVATQDVLQHGFDGYIASAGGYIVVDDQVIYETCLNDNDLKLAIDCFENHDILYNLEANNATYMDEPMLRAFFQPMVTETCSLQDIIKRESKYFNFKPLQVFKDYPEPIQKMCFIAHNSDQLKLVEDQLGDKYHVVVHQNFSFENKIAGEIIIKDTDKGFGVRKVLNHLNIKQEDSICFGDSMNDHQMMEACGYSIVMGNGDNKVKKLADEVCPSVEEDGIYHALKKLAII